MTRSVCTVCGGITVILMVVGVNTQGFSQRAVKQPAVAGMFYPASREKLSSVVETFIRETEVPEIKGDIIGVIAPHAGYIYSGKVAGYAFKPLRGKNYQTVIVMGPSHHTSFRGVSVWKDGFFQTPLGNVPVDEEAASFILDNFPQAHFYRQAFLKEHSVEVEIPFLQKTLKDFKIVPVVFGYMSLEDIEEFARLLKELSQNRNILVVASSDLSHYHSYSEAKDIDLSTIDYIKRMAYQDFYNDCLARKIEACGFEPITCLLIYAKDKGAQAVFLKYLNSGDTSGNFAQVVGYSAFCFVKKR